MAISVQALKKLLPYPLPFLKSYWKMNSAKRKDSWKMREKRGSRKRVPDMWRSQRKSPTWWASRLKVRTVSQGEINWLLNIHESSKRIFRENKKMCRKSKMLIRYYTLFSHNAVYIVVRMLAWNVGHWRWCNLLGRRKLLFWGVESRKGYVCVKEN